MTTLAEEIKLHSILGLDFRIPTEGNTYIKFNSDGTIEFYCNGSLSMKLP
jgi:hypothetical protein